MKAKKETNRDVSPYTEKKKPKVHMELNIRELPWTDKQKQFIDLALDKDTKVIIVKGVAGTAKAQPLTSKILTPEGWTTMGALKPNDEVISVDGKPCKVISIHPQGKKDIYRVTFSDKSSTLCCKDHLWKVKNDKQRNWQKKINGKSVKSHHDGEVLALEDLMDNLIVRGRKNYSIPMVSPVEFPKKSFIISPYLMGVILGDGSTRYNVTLSSDDEEIINKVKDLLPENHSIKKIDGNLYDYRIVGHKQKNQILDEVRALGLSAKYSYEKFIPTDYLFSSVEDRIELLRGLMDTDGTVTKDGYEVCFCTTSERLKHDFIELIRSLGGIAKVSKSKNFYTYKGERKLGRDAYKIYISLPSDINPFFLPRKHDLVVPKTKYKPVRYITNIELIGEEECQCILVDHPSHLYITDEYIVTHNTILAVYCALQKIKAKKASEIYYSRVPVESSIHGIGYIKGTSEEKMSPYTQPLVDKLNELLIAPQVQALMSDERIVGMPLGFLRGLNISNATFIMDEAQNCRIEDFLLVMTRMANFSTLFICGDVQQSDIKNSGFEKVFNLFDTECSKSKGVHTFEFGKEDIVRSEILSYIIERFEELKNSR